MIGAQILLAQESDPAVDFANPSIVKLAESLRGQLDLLSQPQEVIEPLTELNMLWSVVFIFIGGLCVLNGYRWHKTLVVMLAAMGGVTAGLALGPEVGAHGALTGAAGGALVAVLALPLMRYTVALLAGLAGAFVGANLWTSVTQDSSQHMFGSVVGLIVLGMLAFVAFRMVIIAFTSILGAVLLTTGVLSALLKVDTMHEGLVESLNESPRILPIITGVVAVIGFTMQQSGGFKGMNEAANKPSAGGAKPAQAQG